MKRVYVDVVADLFHIGHLNLFKKAKYLFDEPSYLIVGVHCDADVASYKRTPIYSEEERYELVKSCKYVDHMIPAAPLNITKDFIVTNKIDYVAHGDDTSPYFAEQHLAPLQMGIMKYLPYTQGISTTQLIQKITKMSLK